MSFTRLNASMAEYKLFKSRFWFAIIGNSSITSSVNHLILSGVFSSVIPRSSVAILTAKKAQELVLSLGGALNDGKPKIVKIFLRTHNPLHA